MGLIASVTGILVLAVWFLWTGSSWPVLVGLVAAWLFCLLYWRGVLFWVLFIAASVLVVVWLLDIVGRGVGLIVLVLISIALAFGKPRRRLGESA